MKEDGNIEGKNMDKLIRESLGFDKSPEGMTDRIMDKIFSAEQVEDKALESLMRKHMLESPSPGFAASIMSQIEKASASSISIDPVIIGKKAWTAILIGLSAFIIWVVRSGEQAQLESGPIGDASSRMRDFFTGLQGSLSFQIPEILTNPLLGISLFALSSLLLLDYLLKDRRFSWI